MNQRIILFRDSHDKTTFAVVEFAGCPENELLARLRRAIRLWIETEQGHNAACRRGRGLQRRRPG